VDLDPTDEQQSIVDVFGDLAESTVPLDRLRDHEPLGFAPELWARLVAVGAPGMAVPETAGGAGAGLLDLALAVEALGRRLAPAPLVEHAVAARLLAQVDALTPEVLDGASVATLALRRARDQFARLVPAGAVATTVVAYDGLQLVVLDGEPGVHVANLASAPLADRGLDGARVVASGALATSLYRQAVDEWRVLTASALVGLGLGALEIGLRYVSEREQFGVPIGSFQALQHTLADVSVALDGAQLLARKAAWAHDTVDDRAPDRASELGAMAFLFAAEQAQRASDRALHFHGGYGFMEEYDIQLFYRRAKGWANVLDDPAREYARLADLRYGPVAATASPGGG
jgi:alkylation response protein AidB-like acyl-CoA dehydrogenase